MSTLSTATIRISGKDLTVPATVIGDRTVYTLGRFPKIAYVLDEELLDDEVICDLPQFLHSLKCSGLGADVLTFAQKLSESQPRHPHPFEWENAAVIPITTYDDWWKNRIGSKTRNVIRKAQKCGIETRIDELNDDYVRGVVTIFNETPIRQGRPFWHYGKNFETVKREISHCPQKSRFIGAYLAGELVGFAKLLRKGAAYDLVLILSMDRHRDKYVTNTLIAKSYEACVADGLQWLQYARFTYANKGANSLTDFKRHNGFEQINYPRYYIPLTVSGRLAHRIGLHHGIKGVLPVKFLDYLRTVRAKRHAKAAGAAAPKPVAETTSGA